MAKRKVTMYSTKLNKMTEIETDAQFFGQLKNELGLNPDNERILVRETKITLEHDEAELPEGDFYIFVSAKKQKSGAADYIAPEDYETTKYNDLRSYAKKVLGKAPASKPEIIQALVKFNKANGAVPTPKVVKAETKASQAKIVEKVKEQGFVFSPEIEAKLNRILRNQVLISDGINVLLNLEGEETIILDDSVAIGLVENSPAEEQNVVTMSAEQKAEYEAKIAAEKKRQEDEAKKEALAREARSLGM